MSVGSVVERIKEQLSKTISFYLRCSVYNSRKRDTTQWSTEQNLLNFFFLALARSKKRSIKTLERFSTVQSDRVYGININFFSGQLVIEDAGPNMCLMRYNNNFTMFLSERETRKENAAGTTTKGDDVLKPFLYLHSANLELQANVSNK